MGCSAAPEVSRPKPGHEIYNAELRNTVVPDVARYLRRTVLVLETDSLSPGAHAPSELYASANDWASERLIAAIQSGNTSTFEQPVKIDVFAPMPRQLTALEALTAQRGMEHFPSGTRPQSRTSGTACNSLDCATQTQQVQQLGEALPRSAESPDSIRIRDLDYVINVVPTALGRCCRAYSDAMRATTEMSRDLGLEVAEEEERKRSVEIASAAYAEEDVLRLIFLLPLKYRDKVDSSLGLPNRLDTYIRSEFANLLSAIARDFPNRTIERTEITFDLAKILNMQRYGPGWFQALAHPKGELYFSPLLVRAPLFTCYNKGVFPFVELEYRLRANLGDTGWRSKTEEDIRAVAQIIQRYDRAYRDCVEAELYFVAAHEVGHLLGDNVSEEQADCFAYIQSKRNGRQGLGLLESVVFVAAEADAQPLIAKRKATLTRLRNHLAGHEMPAAGEASSTFCSEFAHSPAD